MCQQSNQLQKNNNNNHIVSIKINIMLMSEKQHWIYILQHQPCNLGGSQALLSGPGDQNTFLSISCEYTFAYQRTNFSHYFPNFFPSWVGEPQIRNSVTPMHRTSLRYAT